MPQADPRTADRWPGGPGGGEPDRPGRDAGSGLPAFENPARTDPISPQVLHAVVLNWNLPFDTIACVASLQQGSQAPGAITVVDNGSTDESMQVLPARLGASVRLLGTGSNLGYAGGMNMGIEYALVRGARAVLLLNNDTVVAPDMVQHLLQALEELPRAGIVAPAVYRADRPEQVWRLGDLESHWLPLTRPVPAGRLARLAGRPLRVDYVTGCAMLVRRAVFDSVGLLDPAYFMYFEDADLCHRARRAGYQIWVVPRSRMWHKVATSAARVRPVVRYSEAWGRARFYRRRRPGRLHWLAPVYLVVRTLKTVQQDLRAGERGLAHPAWLGLLDGYRGRPLRQGMVRREM